LVAWPLRRTSPEPFAARKHDGSLHHAARRQHRPLGDSHFAAIRAEHAIEFGPLVSNPPKIICIGLNYRGDLAETGMSPQEFPDLFNKYNTALNRHNGTIAVSTLDAKEFDYESELVVLMGKEARNVSEADALSYVFGYTAGNDFSARDLQLRTSQWMTGKTPDQFAPIGPWLVTGRPAQAKTAVRPCEGISSRRASTRTLAGRRRFVGHVRRYVAIGQVSGDVPRGLVDRASAPASACDERRPTCCERT
jgi:2-keto-4-pentenoate hydratase/2-oxohepta-3-ene-1,7-dioic acid hydratase in catechol pathway